MNEFNIKVDIKNNKLIAPVIELVQNDYNSTKFIFNFIGDNDYTKVLQLQLPDGSIWIKDIVNNQIVLADEKNGKMVPILVQNGKYIFDVAVYSNNAKLTTTNQESFFVRSEIVGQDVQLDDRLPILDDLINKVDKAITETNNLDIDIADSIITITKKDGSKESATVSGGKVNDVLVDGNSVVSNGIANIDLGMVSGLEKVLKDILEAIQQGGTTSMVIEEIEQIIVSYFENKTVGEVEE